MTQGISITITRVIETRKPFKGERWSRIWNGNKWVSLSAKPLSPNLAWVFGYERKVMSTTLEFLPHGIVPNEALIYRRRARTNPLACANS